MSSAAGDPPSAGIHPTAVVHPSAKIGAGGKIDPYAVIGPDVELGRGTWVGAHAVVEFATVGEECRLHPHSFVGTEPQDLKFKGEKTRARLGARTTVRECVTIHRGTAAAGETVVGSNCLLMAYGHVAHDAILADGVIMANAATLAGHVEVGPGAFIGGLVGVHQFARIGAGAMIGAGSMVPADVAPFCMVQGDRAKIVGLNVVGLRRRGTSRDALSAIKAAYRTVFGMGLPLAEAIAQIEKTERPAEVQVFLEFLKKTSHRGLCRPAPKTADGEDATEGFF
ncbi:MAG TPA: acyl-ACP--UDP-N-acetylglucosamine O-acyltransferase [Elusimicrobiota bacterium]|nr:acyl-ACP--UDP-N-acetylglucosamine O-acyltransferase [Elusimicrobiota bacterium]